MVLKKIKVSSKFMKKLTKKQKASKKTKKNKKSLAKIIHNNHNSSFSSHYHLSSNYMKIINDKGQIFEKGSRIIDNSSKPMIEINTIKNGNIQQRFIKRQ